MFNDLEKAIVKIVLESASGKLKDESTFSRDTNFYEIGVDSISMLSILLRLEEKFKLDLMALGDELEAPDTFGDLFILIERLTKTFNSVNIK